MTPREAALSFSSSGGLVLLLTAAAAAFLHRAVAVAGRDGRTHGNRRTHVALIRAWLGFVLAGGVGLAVLLAAQAFLFLKNSPASLMAFQTLMRAWLRLYMAWYFALALTIPVAGRWAGPTIRSFRLGRKASSILRLSWRRFIHSRPATVIRSLARKYDRPLW